MSGMESAKPSVVSDSMFRFGKANTFEDEQYTQQTVDTCTTSNTSSENKLLDRLGSGFFGDRQVKKSEVSEKIQIIKEEFEDAGGCDEDLVQAIAASNFALICFLLNVIVSQDGFDSALEDAASRCVAFAAGIYSNLWPEFCAAPEKALLALQACKKAGERIGQLVASLPKKGSPNEHGGYLGYDERDRLDFDSEGYTEVDKTHLEEEAARIQDTIMVWLLMMYQIFSQPLSQISKKVIACRTRKNNRYSSRRLQQLKRSSNTELIADIYALDLALDNLDMVAFFTDLTAVLLDLLIRKCLTEDAHCQCIKVVTVMNMQMPRLQQADTNEVATYFAAADCGESGENLSQGILYLLNECGYPNIHNAETLAVIRLCKDLLHVEKPEAEDEETEDSDAVCTNYARGHFYTNDVKVMVDIIVRELCNIPHNSSGLVSMAQIECGAGGRSSSTAELVTAVLHGLVRYAYLELLDAIISKSSWTSSGDCYMKDTVKSLLEEIVVREDRKSRDFATDLLGKYSYYLN